jgi:acetylornithine deacetylase/succinyl-diaminopimelate desuccinylase-like protein
VIASERLERTVADVTAIAAIPAPTFSEELRLAWLEKRLADAPGRRRRDGAGNLIWTIGGDEPRVLVAAHVDTVFDVDTPLEITRDGSTLRGPGVGDNAAAVAVALSVFEALADGSISAAVAFTVGEEGLGNLRGARAACEDLAPQYVIALEGHGLDRVVVDAVGSTRLCVAVRGPGGHPWVDGGTPSAVHALLELGAGLLNRHSSDPVVNIGTVRGGRSVNSIADHAELLVEARSLDSTALARFERQVESLCVPAPLELAVDVLGQRPAGRLDRQSRLLQIVLAVRDELGLDTLLDAGSTDANIALGAGVQALTLGVTNGAGMHTTGEWIDWPSLAVGAEQLEQTLVRLAGRALP